MPAVNNDIPDPAKGQDPTVPDSDPTGSTNPRPAATTWPYPDLDSVPAGNPALSNAKIILIGSMAISHLLVGYPARNDLPDADLVMAGRYLWLWYLALATARTKRDFIKRLSFLLWG